MNGKTAIAKILRIEGVEFVSCLPENPLIDACVAVGIRPIITRTERAAVNIADGFSRTDPKGRVGVCIVQYGPGIENSFAGVAQAYGDSVPILILPGRWSRRRSTSPPDFDAVLSFSRVTKWAAQVNFADRAPSLLRRAFTAFRAGRPGPVLLEVPADVAEEEFDDRFFDYEAVPSVKPGPDPAAVADALNLLFTARRPLLLAGQGIHFSRAWDELRSFAELLNLPVVTSMGGKSSFPENHRLSLGVAGLSVTGPAAEFIRQADVILAVGSSLTKWWMFPNLPGTAKIIQCTIDDRDLNKDYPATCMVMGDAGLTLREFERQARARIDWGKGLPASDPTAEIADRRRVWLDRWVPKLESDEVPLNPYRIIHELYGAIDPANTIITHDSGGPRDQLAPFWTTTAPLTYLGWGHSTQLGYSLALALGAKLANPDRLVINVLGDTAFGMCAVDLETAARNRIGLLTILLNNSAMGNYEKHMPLAVEKFGAKGLTGDYVQVATGLGAHAERVTTPDAIAPAIRRAIEQTQQGKPAVVEFITREEPALSLYA